MALIDQIRIAGRFHRSVRIDTDINDSEALSGFICPRSSADVLENLARHVADTGQGAFTWTGPYGSGKSSLVVALSALLSSNRKVRERVASIVGKDTAEKVWTALSPQGEGWRTLPVVGRRERIASVIGEALVESGLAPRKRSKEWSEKQIMSILTKNARENLDIEGGIIVFVDEMGKFLEAATHDRSDIYLLQQLAELSSRSDRRMIFIGILHQAFEEYANRMSREVRDEWSKIQGRFIDIAINVTGDEQINLLSRAIESDQRPKNFRDLTIEVAKMARTDDPMILAKTLEECWPLHPLVACLLGPMSRRRFGQNQRSIFGFLNSSEPEGFQDFLKTTNDESLYTVEKLWNYLKINLEPSILASPDGHRWALATDVIARCEAVGGQERHLRLLKIIALVDLFKDRTRMYPNHKLLECAARDLGSKKVKKTLLELEEDSFLIFRKFTDAYSIFEGSDFDIDHAVARASELTPVIDFSELNCLAGLQPIVAKRHYHETGSLRWFDLVILPLAEVNERVAHYTPKDGAIGGFLLAIPTENETKEEANEICLRAQRRNKDGNIMVGISPASWNVSSLGQELLALEKVRQDTPDLHGDRVARLEVQARITAIRSQLEVELNRIFGSAQWYRKNHTPKKLSIAEVNSFASDMADKRFSKAPYLHNELLNRTKPSSSAIAAQNLLLQRMILDEGKPRLGITGFPADGGLFASLLEAPMLYRDGVVTEPKNGDDPSNLRHAFIEARRILMEDSDRVVAMSEIYDKWKNPPYGIKNGVMAILGTVFILSQRKNTALYRRSVFQARLTDVDIECLTKHPEDIQLRWMKLSDEARSLLSELATVVQELDDKGELVNSEPIDIGRGLVALHDHLPTWTKRTQYLSENAKKVRQILKQAKDPNKLIFDDLPKLLDKGAPNGKNANLQATGDRVRDGLIELREAYPNMLTRLCNLLLEELEVPNSSEQNLIELRDRAKNIRELDGDHRMEAFVVRIAKFDTTDEIIESLASMAVNKPAQEWVDADINHAKIELAKFARKFIRSEAYAHVKGRSNKRHAMAVVVGIGSGSYTAHGEFDITDLDRKQVTDLIRRLDNVLGKNKIGNDRLVLAALAQLSAKHLKALQSRQSSDKISEPRSIGARKS